MTKQRKRDAGHPGNALPQFMLKRVSEGGFILVLTAALFILLSLVTYRTNDPGWLHAAARHHVVANAGGTVGAYIADALYFVFGYMAYLLPLCFAFISWIILKDHRALRSVNKAALLLRSAGLMLLLIGGCGLLALEASALYAPFAFRPGGIIGQFVSSPLNQALNLEGATLLLFALLLVGLTWLTGFSWIRALEFVGCYTLILCRILYKGIFYSALFFKNRLKNLYARERVTDKPGQERKIQPIAVSKKITPEEIKPAPAAAAKEPARKKTRDSSLCNTVVSGTLPSLSLLNKGQPGKPFGGYSPQELENLSREVEQHLLDFGIQADVVSVHPGPVITRFELQLAAGVKASKLTALSKDLARSLSVTSVRVVEIIPGKTVVGIELPNQNRATVNLSEVLTAEVYQQAHSPLTLALGVDIAGHPMVVDLAKMPHLLVAGTTGSGKSVGINAMILSLLFKATPQKVRLIMVDPKMLELSVYDGIPHLLTPVVTDMKEAASALRWCVGEMERRYRLMASFGVRNLAGFNAKLIEARERNEPLTDPFWKPEGSTGEEAPILEPLPYIVVVIDELADMMMVVGKKVEQLIARIAQKARAAGIHLILATQRPSVDVLTGLIKSNIPTRISFQVSSKIDSRTILDQQGAEQLLGYGDMLFLAPGSGAPLRVHGAFVDDKEVHRIADDWRARGTPDYIEEITQTMGDGFDNPFGDENQETEDADPLYDQAVEFVIETRKASISAVQRRFKIGYNRAARLVEEMERTGIVGPLEGGFRDVLVSAVNEDA
ncbi:DNA translocase FtsK [Legionella londiniensis]|uniref:DNA translocase FtsK n=1 Tax=Legionella londiniensis TaxID=45068 RepID=A0A0W0VP33_9GAMM|nr:DNA translocase FtsK [Legionella londiniensis]KTD21709.1 cell division protein FtsK [Legionella londiniensis]STX93455.1 cell division protein FtsK [Legionella londiniensis]